MSLDPAMLDVLACPDIHHAPLAYDEAEQTLTCTECRRIFEIGEGGVPNLVLDQARPASGPAGPTSASTAAGGATAPASPAPDLEV